MINNRCQDIIEALCKKLNDYEKGSTEDVRRFSIKDDCEWQRRIESKGFFVRIPPDHKIVTLNYTNGMCHYSSSLLYKNFSKYRIVTGYAYDKEDNGMGYWVRHTWVVDESNKDRITETADANRREIYYGYMLSDVESEKFCNKFLTDTD
jgi:hypothetical protein